VLGSDAALNLVLSLHEENEALLCVWSASPTQLSQKAKVKKSYQAAVLRGSVHLFLVSTPPPATKHQHAQLQVDVAAAVLSLLKQAAASTLGYYTVVPGGAKSWMTPHVAETCARRRLASHQLDPSPENLQRFRPPPETEHTHGTL
jgi:hypothetical protein